jgi:hypothetical protein
LVRELDHVDMACRPVDDRGLFSVAMTQWDASVKKSSADVRRW